MISTLQVRAAQPLLGWSQARLAEEVGVSVITVKRLEASEETFGARFETVVRVKEAVERAGVVFGAEAHSVSLRR